MSQLAVELKMKDKRLKKVKRFICIYSAFFIFNFSFLIPMKSDAAFQDPGWSARAEGMGGVFCASGLDASAILYNPAGMESLKSAQALFMGFKPYMNLPGVDWNYYLAAGAVPAGRFTMGFAYAGYNAQSVYSENTFLLSASSGKWPFNFGGSLKYMEHSYKMPSQMSPMFSSSGASAFTADIGGTFDISEKFSAGISAQNVIPADVGIKYEDKVPMLLRSGVCLKEGNLGPFGNVLMGFDADLRNQTWGDKLKYGIGAEGWLSDGRVGLRTGYNVDNINLGASYVFRLASGNMELDYSFSLPMEVSGSAGSHRLQLVWMFSSPAGNYRPAKRKKSEKEMPPVEKMSPTAKRILMKGHFKKASGLYGAGRFQEAIDEWKKVLEIDPSHELSKKKIEKAEEGIREKHSGASAPDPAKKSYYFNLGTQYYKQGKYEEAIEEWKKVLQIDPNHELSKEKIEKARTQMAE